MSAAELDRAMIIDRVIEHCLSRVEAARQLGLTPRHMCRLIKAYRERGASALISKKRGKRSNRAYPSAYKAVPVGEGTAPWQASERSKLPMISFRCSWKHSMNGLSKCHYAILTCTVHLLR